MQNEFDWVHDLGDETDALALLFPWFDAIREAQDSCGDPLLWNRLDVSIFLAHSHFEDGDLSETAFYFFQCGKLAERILRFGTDNDYKSDKIGKTIQRTDPFERVNRTRRELRYHVKKLAEKLWAEEPYKNFRTGEMCNEIRNRLEKPGALDQDHKQYLPENRETLRRWIRCVTPERAKRPGRRSKKTN